LHDELRETTAMTDQVTTQRSNHIDQVGHSGVYPVSGPWPAGDAAVVGQGELAHPEERRPRGLPFQGDLSAVALAFGRAVFGGFFLYNGINHFANQKTMVDYVRSKDVASPRLAVLGSGALLILGGLSLITGVRPKAGASLVTAFLAGVSPKMHDFWNIDDQQQRMQEMVNFAKNMALIGGACFAAAVPEPWPGSMRLSALERGTTLALT
jgi:putative oxidoreductase